MNIALDMTALGQLSATGAEELKDPGAQIEYLFAQQMLQALNAGKDEGEGGQGQDYMSLLSDHLARELAKGRPSCFGPPLESPARPPSVPAC